MRYLLIILLFIANAVQAQFPTTDSLRKYNNKFIQNSPINAFTNQRMNTLLYGIINHIDSARLGTLGSVGVDTLFTINDSTIRYKKNGVFYNYRLPSYTRVINDTSILVNGDTVTVGGSGGSTVSAAAPVIKESDTIKLSYNTEGLRVKDNAIDAKAKVFNSVAALRALTAGDTSSVYRVRSNKEYGEFKYDPDDVSSSDDSAMVLVDASGNRYKRVVADVIYPEDFGAKGDGVTDDAAAFNKMFRWLEQTAGDAFEVRAKHKHYVIEDTVFLPMRITNTSSKKTVLRLNWTGVKFTTTSAIPMFYRMPKTQFGPDLEGATFIIDSYSLHLQGARFVGNFTAGQQALKLGAFYLSSVKECNFSQFDTAFVAAFWLGSEIKDNEFNSNLSVGFLGTTGAGYWTSATSANSAFNINRFTGNRVYNRSGSLAGVMFLGADGIILRDHISEGANPRYDIYYDYTGNTVVNGSSFENIWFESTGGSFSLNTCFYLRGAGNIDIKGLQNDYADTLIDFVNCASNMVLTVGNFQYVNTSAGVRHFKTTGTAPAGVQILASQMSSAYAGLFTDTTRWLNGSIPFAVSQISSKGVRSVNEFYDIYPFSAGAASNKRMRLEGQFLFLTDNTYNLGGIASTNFRPLTTYTGTGGFVADKAAVRGFGFGNASTAPVQYWSNINDSVTKITSTGAIALPQGTTAQRPGFNVAWTAAYRYNTTLSRYEFTPSTGVWKQHLTNDDTVSISSRITKNLDSLFQHNLRIIKNSDSLSAHNTRLSALENNQHSPVNLTAGTNISITGTYPNLTINSIGGGGTSSESIVKVNNSDYTIADGTGNLSVVFYNTLTAARTLTLPTASTNTGRVIRIKHGGSGLYNINLSTSIYESDTVSFTSIGVGQGVVIQSDGTNWIIIQ